MAAPLHLLSSHARFLKSAWASSTPERFNAVDLSSQHVVWSDVRAAFHSVFRDAGHAGTAAPLSFPPVATPITDPIANIKRWYVALKNHQYAERERGGGVAAATVSCTHGAVYLLVAAGMCHRDAAHEPPGVPGLRLLPDALSYAHLRTAYHALDLARRNVRAFRRPREPTHWRGAPVPVDGDAAVPPQKRPQTATLGSFRIDWAWFKKGRVHPDSILG